MTKTRDYRPKIHLSPETGWKNEPNGIVKMNGVNHIYYQKNPYPTN